MNILLNNEILDSLDYSYFEDKCPDCDAYIHFFKKKSGEAHYRLLSYLSTQFNNIDIIDIGTNKGSSALALNYNKNNKIYSFDLKERCFFIEEGQKSQVVPGRNYFYHPNVNFIVGNFLNFKDIILESPLILYDTNHNGVLENEFFNFLISNNYKGLVIFDDIHLNNEMKEFWNNITYHKYDLTKYGNQTGTGLIDFNSGINFILE